MGAGQVRRFFCALFLDKGRVLRFHRIVLKKPLKISIRAQIFFAFLGVVVLLSAVFSPYGFYTNVHSIRASVDERLRVAANGVLEILPDNYHERLFAGKVLPEEYKALQAKLVDYKDRVGITFLYCVVRSPDGKFYFSLEQELPPFTLCGEDSVYIGRVFDSREMMVAQGPDGDYGIVSRTVYLPVEMGDGRMFVVGADLNVDVFRPMIVESLFDFLMIMLSGIVLVLIMTMLVSKRLSFPIRALSDFTKRLADSDFSPELTLESELPADKISTREVSLLAGNIELMRVRLSDYLKRIESEAFARQRIESELKLAGRLQASFLPGAGLSFADVEVAAFMKTARESGGDLYDFFELPSGRLCFTIGDVAGKGIAAALFMARAMSLIRSAAQIFRDLESVAAFINRELCAGNDSCTFLTFFIATYDARTHEVRFVNCGHNPPFLKRADSSAYEMKVKPNSVLGIFEDAVFESESFVLGAGEVLVCYTDGVTEAVSSDSSFYGEARLLGVIEAASGVAAEYADAVVADVEAFSSGCEQADDITMLVVRRNP